MSGFADSINRSQQHIDNIASSLSNYFSKQKKQQEEEDFFNQFSSTQKGKQTGAVPGINLPKRAPVDVKPEPLPALPAPTIEPVQSVIPTKEKIIATTPEGASASIPVQDPSKIDFGADTANRQNAEDGVQQKEVLPTETPVPVGAAPVGATFDEKANVEQVDQPKFDSPLSLEQTLNAMATENPEILKNPNFVNALEQAKSLKALRPDPMQKLEEEYKKAQIEKLGRNELKTPEQFEARAVVKEAEGDVEGAALDRAAAKAMRESVASTTGMKKKAEQEFAPQAIPTQYLNWAKKKWETLSSAEKAKYNDSVEALSLDLMQGNDIEKIKARAEATMGSDSSFSDLPAEDKAFWFDKFNVDGTYPPISTRDKKGRNEFIASIPGYLASKGITGDDTAVNKFTMKAYAASLQSQQKSYGMMGGFVRNLKNQISRVEEIQKDLIQRLGVRALDVPIREWKTRFAGSGNERVLESYLIEISNEIAKLSTGSQGSVAELSVGAQERWNKIHDPNLSAKELQKVLDATKEQASARQKTAEEEIVATRKAMGEVGKQGKEESKKTITAKQYSKTANKTKITYSDGTTEIVDGQR